MGEIRQILREKNEDFICFQRLYLPFQNWGICLICLHCATAMKAISEVHLTTDRNWTHNLAFVKCVKNQFVLLSGKQLYQCFGWFLYILFMWYSLFTHKWFSVWLNTFYINMIPVLYICFLNWIWSDMFHYDIFFIISTETYY